MYTFYRLFKYVLLVLFHIFIVECCERSLEIRGVEDYCWTKNVEVVDRLQYTGKSVLNFAKKKLGMDVETEDVPQKCDYYKCIFQELKMLNGNGYPCHEKMTNWIKHNVVYDHAVILLSQVDECSEGLANSTISGTYFYGDKLEDEVTNDDTTTVPTAPQSKCEISNELKCMALVEKNENCPVYQYP